MSERSGQDRDWCVVDQTESGDVESKEHLVDLNFLNDIFPDRDSSTLKSWLTVLVAEEIRCADDILVLAQDEQAWAQLGLPLVVKIKLRQAAKNAAKSQVSTAAISLDKEDPIQQLDCIVLDVSVSMKARSAIDALKTREDVSKLVFLSMVDGILSLEMDHAVSLVSFGKDVSVVGEGVSRHTNNFNMNWDGWMQIKVERDSTTVFFWRQRRSSNSKQPMLISLWMSAHFDFLP